MWELSCGCSRLGRTEVHLAGELGPCLLPEWAPFFGSLLRALKNQPVPFEGTGIVLVIILGVDNESSC